MDNYNCIVYLHMLVYVNALLLLTVFTHSMLHIRILSFWISAIELANLKDRIPSLLGDSLQNSQ
jgi:hypothetical protein